MKKSELRNIYKQKRATLSNAQLSSFNNSIYTHFLNNYYFSHKNIHVYLPILKNNEPDTNLIIQYLLSKNNFLYTSIINEKEKEMKIVQFDKNDEFVCGKLDIPQPKNPIFIQSINFDFIIVPGLYFDKFGNRVGYGQGYYDRFLVNHENAHKIGLQFFEPAENIDEIDSTDIPVNEVLLPSGIFKVKT